jgi:hypothetical protein
LSLIGFKPSAALVHGIEDTAEDGDALFLLTGIAQFPRFLEVTLRGGDSQSDCARHLDLNLSQKFLAPARGRRLSGAHLGRRRTLCIDLAGHPKRQRYGGHW